MNYGDYSRERRMLLSDLRRAKEKLRAVDTPSMTQLHPRAIVLCKETIVRIETQLKNLEQRFCSSYQRRNRA
jgi:hypothetical protein